LRTGVRTDMTKLVVAFRNFSNAPKKRKAGHLRVLWYLYVCHSTQKMEYQDPMLTHRMKHGVFVDEREHRLLYLHANIVA
jgi:hypothetical protein